MKCAFVFATILAACGSPGTTLIDGPPGDGVHHDAAHDGTGSGSDPYAAARQTCIDKINTLRAAIGRTAYTRYTAEETCVDGEVTSDEAANSPHGQFVAGQTCNSNGQNECLGQGVSGIATCLQSMWDEKNQAACSGCDACAGAYTPNCANCDFYGTSGMTCGHYVNMSAEYFTMAACGFSSGGGWDAINFK